MQCKNKGCFSLNGIEAVSWFVVKYYYLRCTRTACSGCHAIPLSSLFDFLGSMSLLAPTTTNACLLTTLSSTHRRCGVWQLYSGGKILMNATTSTPSYGITGQISLKYLVRLRNGKRKMTIQLVLTPTTPYVAPTICRVKNGLYLDLDFRCYKQQIFNQRTDLKSLIHTI